jgi:hypothetical protein
MKTTWRMIVIMVAASLLSVGVSFAALRAFAQQEPPVSTPAPTESVPNNPQPADAPANTPASPPTPEQPAVSGLDPAVAEGDAQYGSGAQDELPPDLRITADDSISFPVDI